VAILTVAVFDEKRFDETFGLYEHATIAAAWVVDAAFVKFEHFY
jgi:hypothetical protein